MITEFEPVEDLSGIEDPVPLSTDGRIVTCTGVGQDVKSLVDDTRRGEGEVYDALAMILTCVGCL